MKQVRQIIKMSASLTYSRYCAKYFNFITPVRNAGIILRFRSDKNAEAPAFDDFAEEVEERLSDEEIDKIRNVSNMPEWCYKKYKGLANFDFKDETVAEKLKTRSTLRKMYVRYGAASGINPSIMWPSKSELAERIKDEQEWQPTFQQLVQQATEKRQLEQAEIDKRQHKITAQMSKMDGLIKDYKKKQEQAKAAEAIQVSERRIKLREEAEEYYGYPIEMYGPKFKEFVTMKMEAETLKKKQAKKELRKKEKEDYSKVVLERAQARKEKQEKQQKDEKEAKKKDSDDED